MEEKMEKRIDVYLAGSNKFDGTVDGIRVRVHPGKKPGMPDDMPAVVGVNLTAPPAILNLPHLPLLSIGLAPALKRAILDAYSKSAQAAERGRSSVAKRRGRG